MEINMTNQTFDISIPVEGTNVTLSASGSGDLDYAITVLKGLATAANSIGAESLTQHADRIAAMFPDYKIPAIKELRNFIGTSNLGLKEAKELIEDAQMRARVSKTVDIDEVAIRAKRAGADRIIARFPEDQKTHAVREMRSAYSMTLKQARDFIWEAYGRAGIEVKDYRDNRPETVDIDEVMG